MMAKCDVNGANTCDTYAYLRNNSILFDKSTQKAKEIPWNFAKFLVNSDGKVEAYFAPQMSPLSFEEKVKAML